MSRSSDLLRAAQRAQYASRCRDAVARLSEIVAPTGARLLAIKGIYISYLVARDPWARAMLDADVLVSPGDFPRAVEAVRAQGEFRVGLTKWPAVTLVAPNGATVDVHRIPLPPLFGRMSAESLWARARPAPALGPLLWAPEPVDAAVLALAGFAKDALARSLAPRVARDLALLSERAAVTPPAIAARLRAHRLHRIGLLAATALASSEPGAVALRDALREGASRLELRLCASASSVIAHHLREGAYVSYLVVRTCGDDPLDAALGLGFGLVRWGLARARGERLEERIDDRAPPGP